MTDVAVRPAEQAAGPAKQHGRRADRVGVVFKAVIGLVVTAAVVVRFTAGQALWLDEAQSAAIAGLPLTGDGITLFEGLRRDGSPPLYYLVLHFWIEAFGAGAIALRALSALINLVAAVPLYLLARRLVGETAARVAVLLYLTSPFALYFATETRMYSLIVLLTALGGLALERTLRAPSPRSVAALALASGALALTHYWALYLLLTVGLWLLASACWPRLGTPLARWAASRPGQARATADGPAARADRAVAASAGHGDGSVPGGAAGSVTRVGRTPLYGALGIIGGGVVFAPWLGGFFYQLEHTGTPWGEPASYAAISHAYGQWAGGPTTLGRILLLVVTALVAFGVAGRAVDGRFILFDLRGKEPGRTLFLLATVTLVVAVTAGKVVGNAWADRYTATAFVPFLLVVGLGATMFADRRVFQGVVATAAMIGLLAGIGEIRRDRTQAEQAGVALATFARPGDVMLVCPDQLGPGLARTVPPWLKVYLVPTYAAPDRVDWIDYEQRNTAADGVAIADRALAEAGSTGTVFMAASGGYRTFEELCVTVRTRLESVRPNADLLMQQSKPAEVYENYMLLRFQPS